MKALGNLCALIVALSCSCPQPTLCQEKAPQRSGETLSTSEVLLDVVVRDKKGRIVRDLKQSDFEVFEDNVRQDVASFRLVLRESSGGTQGATTTAQTPTTAKASQSLAEVGIIAMVFDHLSTNAQSLARKAANGFLDQSLHSDDQVSVCVIDDSLRIVQQFTNDRQLLKQAVDKGTIAATTTYAGSGKDRADLRQLEERVARLENAMTTGVGQATGPGVSPRGIAAREVDYRLTQMALRSLQVFEMLERTQQGRAQINSLLAIVNSLRNAPGRKAIVLFSEGLSLPSDVSAFFQSVINAANQANVSIYAIDAAGLRVESGNAETVREVTAQANLRVHENETGGPGRSGRPMTMGLERNEDLLRLNPHSGLGQLADSTGGLLIADTNDLTGGLGRIDEDLRAHYELSYTPKNSSLDGRFRRVEVRVGRGGLETQTRKGYFALPGTGDSPVLGYEAPVLAAMAKTKTSEAFPLRSMAFSFPGGESTVTPVLAEVSGNAFSYVPSADKKTYSTDFSIVCLIRDERQQVVSKLSRHYSLTGPIDRIQASRQGDILFYKQDQLPAGRYTMQTAAFDAPSQKISIQEASFEVPRSDNTKLRAGTLFILKRAERLSAEEQREANPFHFGELLIYPNLGEPIRKSAMKQLPFFVEVAVRQREKAGPKMTVEVSQGNKAVARMQSELPAPDASGRIQFASAIPLEDFQPGAYELKIILNDGQQNVTRTVGFSVAP